MLTEIAQQAFAIKLFGQPWGAKYATRQLAEMAIAQLSPQHQALAEVIAIERDSGKEMLFG